MGKLANGHALAALTIMARLRDHKQPMNAVLVRSEVEACGLNLVFFVHRQRMLRLVRPFDRRRDELSDAPILHHAYICACRCFW